MVGLTVTTLLLYRDTLRRWRYERLETAALLKTAQENPRDVTLLEVAGQRMLNESLTDSLRPQIVSAASEHPINVRLNVLAARFKMEEGDLQGAGEFLKRALESEPNNPDALFWSAKQLYRRGRKQMAEQLLHQVLKVAPERGEAWQSLGEMALEGQDYVAALEHFEKAESIQPSAQTAFFQAQALQQLGRLEEAEQAARLSLKREASAPNYALLGKILQGMPDEAKLRQAQQALETAVELDGTNAENLKMLALTYRAAGRHQEAIKKLRRLIRLTPAMSEAYLLLSQSYAATGQKQKSQQVLKIFAYLSPLQKRADTARHRVIIERGALPAQLAQVKVLLELGRNDLARDVLERAWAKAPGHPEIKRLARLAEGPSTMRIPPLPSDPVGDAH